MKKRVMAVVLALVLLLCVGCGKGNEPVNNGDYDYQGTGYDEGDSNVLDNNVLDNNDTNYYPEHDTWDASPLPDDETNQDVMAPEENEDSNIAVSEDEFLFHNCDGDVVVPKDILGGYDISRNYTPNDTGVITVSLESDGTLTVNVASVTTNGTYTVDYVYCETDSYGMRYSLLCGYLSGNMECIFGAYIKESGMVDNYVGLLECFVSDKTYNLNKQNRALDF